MTPREYDEYVRREWARFFADPGRVSAALRAVAGRPITRVLDIGCGAGQELFPFVCHGGALGVGLDRSPEVGRAGRELYRGFGVTERVRFLQGEAEALPFPANSFDLVICRLALPYTDNARALQEMGRVLRPEGAMLLKIHHARFYLTKFGHGLLSLHVRSSIHAVRVLVAGMLYHLTARQPRNQWIGCETFQTIWMLHRELRRHGLQTHQELPDSNPLTPSFLIIKAH